MNRRAFLGGSFAAFSLQWLPSLAQAQDTTSRKQIIIGQTADLSGGMQNIGRDYFTGAKVAFDQANIGDGAGGKRIKFIQLDDAGDPVVAAANAKRLIEDERADLLFGLTSESCVEAVANCAAFKNSDIEIFAPVTGIEHLGAKGRAVYLRPSSAEELVSIMDRMTKLSLSRLAVIHTASPSMIAARDAAFSGIKERYFELPRAYTLKDSASNAQALVSAVEKDQIQAAVIMADSISAALLIKQLRPRMPALFICLSSTVDVSSVQQIVGQKLAHGLMVSRVVPDPNNGVVPVVMNFKRSLSKYLDEPPTPAGLEGYIAAQTLLAVLRKAENPRHLASVAQRRVGMLDVGGWKVNLANTRAVETVEMAMVTRDGKLI